METDLLLETPVLERENKYHHDVDAAPKLLSTPVATSMAINFIMGSGFLGLPYAFNATGQLLAVIGMLVVTAIAMLSVGLLLQTMRRAEALTLRKYDPIKHRQPCYDISTRKFEIVEMVDMFIGRRAKQAYAIIVSTYLMGVTWGYVVVFGAAFTSHVPLPFVLDGRTCDVYQDSGCEPLYRCWALVFMVVFCIASCFDLKEQEWLQVIMTILRITLITVMTATVLVAIISGTPMFQVDQNGAAGISMKDIAKFAGFPAFLPIAMYSQQLLTGVPVLTQATRNKKNVLFGVFGSTFTFTLLSYTVASVIISYYLGVHTDPSCNVNWAHFTGGHSMAQRPTWASLVSYLVVLFPAIDVLSISPINSIILASNVMSAWYGERTPKMEKNRKLVILFRLGFSVPPAIGGVFFYQLNNVLDATGVISMIIGLIIPPVLWLLSERQCNAVWPSYARLLSRDADRDALAATSPDPDAGKSTKVHLNIRATSRSAGTRADLEEDGGFVPPRSGSELASASGPPPVPDRDSDSATTQLTKNCFYNKTFVTGMLVLGCGIFILSSIEQFVNPNG